ncbi:Nucleic acid-binding, OB-fold-like protein [Akanthomyces lecanii RCEF 1005]|uniref:Nucleic acid-binding, OB-fold-like protein n=1 Tax=Akanthomyces lecanii RCEF 1005 TaxID=1081108 RepID=A0A162JZJ4_CORDF|nr:Nucleic acid-binding, OB-fold-like protein [Akanthomyces lecanii RCEF 1005]
MAEATARASAASSTLDAQTPTPIAQLKPELVDRESRVIDGVVTITWPYSIVTHSAAFILAEHDFRLRHARGQLRLEFHGQVGQKLADAGIGGGDALRISLEGAEWEAHKSQTRVPGTILEWQLKFTNRLLMRVQRADDQQTEILDLTLPDDANGNVAPLATLTPQGSSPVNHSGLFATEVVSTPGTHSPNSNLPAKRLASYAFEPAEYASPAFLKRARVSYGSLFEDGFDIFDEDVAKRKKKKAKRSRFSMGATGWKYSSRSPSPEPKAPELHELESDGEEGSEADEPDEPIVASLKSPAMVDESSQTLDTSFAFQIAEQARESASLIPSSPTPMTFGKPQEQPDGHFAAPIFGGPSTTKQETASSAAKPNRPLFGGSTNISASAVTAAPPQSSIFGSSFGNSGFSVEHTTTASTSSIPVFNDALAESMRSRDAAEERAPGQPELAFDISTNEAYPEIDTNFGVTQSLKDQQHSNPFATTEFPLPAAISNPFAVEPFPHATLSAQEQPEDDIYEANTYPEIQEHEQILKESKPHAFDLPRTLDQMRSEVAGQKTHEEEEAEEQDESTDYDIEAGEPPRRLQAVESEQEQDEEEDDAQGEYDDEEESGLDEHCGEDDEGHYDDDDEEGREYSDGEDDDDEEEEEEEEEPAARDRPASQDPVYISLLSDSEDEAEPSTPVPAPTSTAIPPKSAELELSDEDEEESEDESEGDDESARQISADEGSHTRESSREEAVVEHDAGDEDASADEHLDEVDIVKRLREEDQADAEPRVSPAAETESAKEMQVSADEMDVDEVGSNSVVGAEPPLKETASRSPSPITVDKVATEVDAMEEDIASEPAPVEATDVNAMEEDVASETAPVEAEDANAMEKDVTPEPAQVDASDIEKAANADADIHVAEAPEDIENEIKSQPDVDMDIKEPEEVEMLVEAPPTVAAEEVPVEQDERELVVEPSLKAPEESTLVLEEIAKEVVEEAWQEKLSASTQLVEELAQEDPEEVPVPEVQDQLSETDVKQLAGAAEVAAQSTTTRPAASTTNRQLLTPIDTHIPVAEAAGIEVIQTTQEQPHQGAEGDADEDDMAASQQIMDEFLQQSSPKLELPPPPLPVSAKEHRRKRSDTVSETGRRTRSQTKQQPEEENEAEATKSSPHSHRRSSRSIDKTNDLTVDTSIESNTSLSSKNSDRTPLLHRSFRITRSRGTADQADPSVAIAKAAAASTGRLSASPRSAEHTPSRPIMLRVTRSMENIAEAGLKEGLVIPDASVRSVRLDDASSSGTRSPAASTPLTPSTQVQMQLQQEQRYTGRPSESPASAGLRAPAIAASPPPEDAESLATASELKLQLQRDLRTTLPDNLALKSLRTALNKTADMIAVAASTPAPPYRPKNGPRDYMLELLLVDPSSAPQGIYVAHIFRPHQHSLPAVQRGDVVLLRGMTVVAVKDRGFGLRAGDVSAWAVWDEQARQAASTGDVALPQIKGPPVDVMEAEAQYAMGLSRWWALLDEATMSKMERATQRMLAFS